MIVIMPISVDSGLPTPDMQTPTKLMRCDSVVGVLRLQVQGTWRGATAGRKRKPAAVSYGLGLASVDRFDLNCAGGVTQGRHETRVLKKLRH
jgi:hypothetical protein